MAGGLSRTRNPTLMKMFNLVGVGEKAGSGFDTMRAGCEWANVTAPDFSEAFSPDRTMLEMGVPHGFAAVSSGVPVPVSGSVSASRESVLALLAERGRIKRSDVEAELGLGRSAAASLLNLMVGDGLVEKVGAGPSTMYRIVQ